MDRVRNGGAARMWRPSSGLDGGPADPVSSSLLVVPWLVYLHTGDKKILAKCYDGMKRWEAYLERVSDQDIVRFSYFGDWAGACHRLRPGKRRQRLVFRCYASRFYLYLGLLFKLCAVGKHRPGFGKRGRRQLLPCNEAQNFKPL